MPFSPAVEKLAKAAVNPEHFQIVPAASMNVNEQAKGFYFMDEAGRIVQFPKMNHRFTLTFGVSGCSLYCSKNNLALSTMPKDWQHVVINRNPEGEQWMPNAKTDFRKNIEHDNVIDREDVPNVRVLYPVIEVNQAWRVANSKQEHPQRVWKTSDNRYWVFSNAEAVRLQTELGLISNPKNPKAHAPDILTFDENGCKTGVFEADQIIMKKYPLKKGCER